MENNATFFHRQFPLESFKNFIGQETFCKLAEFINPKCRKRLIGLEGFVWLGLFVAAHAAEPSLSNIFLLAQNPQQQTISAAFVSVSAFCQYRSLFPLRPLITLWHILADKARQFLLAEQSLWHGLRPLAVDSTALTLPEALWPKFGSHSGARGDGPAQCQATVLYDLSSRVPLAVKVGGSKENDRPLLKKLLSHIRAGSILVMDMGFYSIEIFSEILKRGAHFLVPMRSNGKPILIKRFGPCDGLYQIKPGSYWRNMPFIPEIMVVRIIVVHRNGFRPRRLVTSLLDPIEFLAEDIAVLYHERWHIETFFREFKHTLKAQCWHARTPHAFYTELIFFMLLATLTRLVMADAAKWEGICLSTLSFGKCFPYLKRALELVAYLPSPKWDILYEELLQRLVCLTIDVRPGRAFERNRQKRRKNSRKRFLEKHTQNMKRIKHAA